MSQILTLDNTCFPMTEVPDEVEDLRFAVLDNSNPKYINSPESDFFKKRNILYNLYNSKQNIRSKKKYVNL